MLINLSIHITQEDTLNEIAFLLKREGDRVVK